MTVGKHLSGGVSLSNGGQSPLLLDSAGNLKTTSGAVAAPSSATYRAVGTGYTAYATPTDLVGIRGSATKTIIVTNFFLQLNSTTAALQTIHFLRRSTANTGGTGAATGTAVPVDSSDAAATATVDVYTAAPTPGTLAGKLNIFGVNSGTLTNAGGLAPMWGSGAGMVQNPFNATDMRKPVILRGVAEALYANYDGAALSGGFTATWGIEWIEV